MIHGVVDSMTVSTGAGQIENFSLEYGRFVKMYCVGRESRNDTLNGSKSSELKTPNVQMSQSLCRGQTTVNDQTTLNDPVSFSFKPLMCLNRVVNGANIPFSKVGFIKVNFKFARDLSFLYGNVADTSLLTYELTNVKLRYIQVPSTPNDNMVQMLSVVPEKSTISSSAATIVANIPTACNAVSISFQKVLNEHTVNNNNQRMDNIDELEQIEFQYNDNFNNGIQYPITDRGEMLTIFLNSMNNTSDHNQVNANKWNGSDGFGIGYQFGLYKNLVATKFSTLLKTKGVNNTNQMNVYLYFHSLLEL